MAKRGKRDYFNINWLLSVILAFIPVTSLVLGIITRFSEGKVLAGILRIILGWNVIWLLDFVCMLFGHHIFRLF